MMLFLLFAGGLLSYPTPTLSANMVVDPGLESGTETSWTDTGNCFTVATDFAHSGTYSVKAVDLKNCAFTNFFRQSLSVTAGKVYRLSGWIKTESLGVATTPQSGVRVSFLGNSSGVFTGTRDWTYFETRALLATTTGTQFFAIQEYGSNCLGTVWVDDLSAVEEIPPAVEAKLVRPSYRGYLWSDLPQEAVFEVVNNSCGSIEWVRTYDSAPGSPTITGASAGTVTVPFTENGTVAFRCVGSATPAYPQYRIETQAASARNTWPISWTNDGRFRVNNVKTFLYGVYDSGFGYSSTQSGWEEKLGREGDTTITNASYRRLAELSGKLNVYLNYWYGIATSDGMLALMTFLNNNHLGLYWQTANCFGSGAQENTFLMDTDQNYAQTLAAHTNFAGTYIMDECLAFLAPGMFTRALTRRPSTPKAADLVVGVRPDDLDVWYDVGDILATDPYPLFGSGAERPMSIVADYTKATLAAVSNARPTLQVLQFFKNTTAARFPTQAELRNMSYMSIVEGVQGIMYWSIGAGALAYASGPGCTSTNWCATKVELWSRLTPVVNEIGALQTQLVADDDTTSMERIFVGEVPAPTPLTGEVRCRVRAGYAFCYNYTGTSKAATFDWLTNVASVTVHNEARTITPTGDKWTDSFGPYEAHVYVIVNAGGGPPPVAGLNAKIGYVGETELQALYGIRGLPHETSCTVTVQVAGGGAQVCLTTQATGLARRVATCTGLTAGTLYDLTVSCTGYDPVSVAGVRTKDLVAGTTSIVVGPLTPRVGLGITQVTVDYGLAPATNLTTTVACTSGCTVPLSSLDRGRLYSYTYTWKDAGGTPVLSTSRVRTFYAE